jgi:cytochrome P450
MLRMSYTIPGGAGAEGVAGEFVLITGEMNDYLSRLLDARRHSPRDDLLTRLLNAELEGERLSQSEILGFFQLLLLAGSETTSNLLSNAIISLCENADAFARLRQAPQTLIPSTIEEVLRYRSPVQWMFRVTREAVDLSGQPIPAGAVVLAMIGSANRDPRQFANPEQFDILRDPNPHIAFGHGAHFCLGSALARLEGRVAMEEFLRSTDEVELASELPWTPNPGLHVHGPTSLPIRFTQRDLAV